MTLGFVEFSLDGGPSLDVKVGHCIHVSASANCMRPSPWLSTDLVNILLRLMMMLPDATLLGSDDGCGIDIVA